MSFYHHQKSQDWKGFLFFVLSLSCRNPRVCCHSDLGRRGVAFAVFPEGPLWFSLPAGSAAVARPPRWESGRRGSPPSVVPASLRSMPWPGACTRERRWTWGTGAATRETSPGNALADCRPASHVDAAASRCACGEGQFSGRGSVLLWVHHRRRA